MGPRQIVAVATVCGMLAAAASFTLAVRSYTPGMSVSSASESYDWEGALRQCAPLRGDAQAECVYQTLVQAVDANQLREANADLKSLVVEDTTFLAACHGPAHRAGQYAWSKVKDLEWLLAQVEDPACEYGLGHGVLDGMADQDPTDENFAEAARVCQSLWNGPDALPDPAYVYCADGTGHAAYWVERDPVEAAKLCALHEEDRTKSECMGGVLMEMFEPAGFLEVSDPDYLLADATSVLPQVCAAVGELGERALVEGCMAGSGYVLTRDAWVLGDRYREEPGADTLDAALDSWVEAMTNCVSLFAEQALPCERMVAYQMHFILREKKEKEACGRLDADLRSLCFANRANIA